MKVVNTGKNFRIYGDGLKVHDQLPVDTYIVRFSQMAGFYLDKYSGLEVNEEKIYGVHLSKINKVMRSFKEFTRNLGIILSGDKGIGKSLFARILCQTSMEAGFPVIVVDTFVPGIHSFLEEIEQEVVVLFDEFDKTFPSGGNDDDRRGNNNGGGGMSAQASLLSLLDGVSSGKKLFVVTCNKFYDLNEYLINRPGRFHYHFRFGYPTANEIRTYLQDKIDKQYWNEINKVVEFGGKVNLNYDCLRAIAYELQSGEKFEDAISDLNILNLNDQSYDLTLCFEDGTTTTRSNQRIDMFNGRENEMWMSSIDGIGVLVKFSPIKSKFDSALGCSIIEGENVEVVFNVDEDEEDQVAKAKQLKAKGVECLKIARVIKSNYQYAV